MTRSRPSAAERLDVPDALLSRSDLRELGLEQRAVNAVFRACPVVVIAGYSRPPIGVEDSRCWIARDVPDREARKVSEGQRPGRENSDRGRGSTAATGGAG